MIGIPGMYEIRSITGIFVISGFPGMIGITYCMSGIPGIIGNLGLIGIRV